MKIGILGFGSMGRTHAYCIKSLPFFVRGEETHEIKAVCTRHIDRAEKIAHEFGIELYTDNEDDIIYSDEIDIIDICTPNIYHYDTAKKAILAGKHVYCEKPLAVTYEQARELAELAREKGVKCQIVFNNRFMSGIMHARELIDEGKLGRILSFNVRYLHSSALDTKKSAGWKQDKDVCGGGVLFDLGSHAVDLVYYLCGKFKSVIGKGQIAYPTRTGMNGQEWKTNADEAFNVIATLECGAVGTVQVSKISLGTNDDFIIEIYGELGSLRFDLMSPSYLEFYSKEQRDGSFGGERGFTKIECVGRYKDAIFPGVKAPIGWLRGHLYSYSSFINAIRNDKEPVPSFDDGAYVQRVLACAYESAEAGREVQI